MAHEVHVGDRARDDGEPERERAVGEDGEHRRARSHPEAEQQEKQKQQVVLQISDDNVKTWQTAFNVVNNLTNTFMMDKEWTEANNATKTQDFKNKEENFAVRNANKRGVTIDLGSTAPQNRKA